jgi:hypothetical protein
MPSLPASRHTPRPGRLTRLQPRRLTTLAVWSVVTLLGLGSGGYVMTRAITGVWPWQYNDLVRQKHRLAIPASYTPVTWEEFLHLPALPKAYEPAEWETVRTYAARGVRVEVVLHR